VDEAHYALYGVHLDWSYFDHPPMIGWLQSIALQFGETDLALRVMPMALFTATSLLLYRVTLILFPHETPWLAFTSVALLQSGAILQLVGLAMLPDSPLLLFGLLVLWALHSIMIQGRAINWLWLGGLLGLAALSKYTAITLVATIAITMILNKRWQQLRSPWPWLAIAISAVLVLPILYWNYRHDWISFLYQMHHGAGKPSWEISRFLLSQAGQFLAYGPGVMVFGLFAIVGALRQRPEPGAWLCLSLALPILLLFGWGSGYEMTLPHWTSLAWASLAPLTAYWLHRHWQLLWVRIGVRISIVYAIAVLALIFSEFISPWLPFKDNHNPLRDLYGWQQAAQHGEQLRQEMDAGAANALLFTDNWTYGSRLAWYARPATVQITDNRFDQFDVWFGSPQNGAHGILVLWPEPEAKPSTGSAGQFAKCVLRDRLPIRSDTHLISTFSFYACDGFKK
jgi:4-amino-4-deoxy-L-arabinose transferase-like glycosyltransferase